ncbi:LysR family transcriptional regulator [Actinomyces radicidentis]|uniref:LysR family transcriptional regulator n=2 Tax=Actinomyces radicidentis TaxID=111015 RepID=A0A109W7D2_ACTRD|nr:LysR family transcriptional regulator [Actinomyces radicidentis]
MHPDQLAALDAIATHGTFEAAARSLGVSTSAVSQRVRALEASLGRILVSRGTPSTMTDDGAVVLRYARQQALLAQEMAGELELEPTDGEAPGASTAPVRPSVAVNADSLQTWFTGLLRRAADRDVVLELVVADEKRTAELLRSGRVMCAVSTTGARVAGCRATRLGTLRYTPSIAPALLERTRRTLGHEPTAGDLPTVRFDADDDLQDLALAAAGLPPQRPRALVPTAAGFAAAIEAGLGWGMLPPGQLAAHPTLAAVPGLEPVDRELFWHRWSITSPSLDALSDDVAEAFAAK